MENKSAGTLDFRASYDGIKFNCLIINGWQNNQKKFCGERMEFAFSLP
jgi:hypothetical protein